MDISWREVYSRDLFSKFRALWTLAECQVLLLKSEQKSDRTSVRTGHQPEKLKWDWGICLFDQIAWRLTCIGAVTFLLFRRNALSQWSNEPHLWLRMCTTFCCHFYIVFALHLFAMLSGFLLNAKVWMPVHWYLLLVLVCRRWKLEQQYNSFNLWVLRT